MDYYLFFLLVAFACGLNEVGGETNARRNLRDAQGFVVPVDNNPALQFVAAIQGKDVPLSVFLWQSTKTYQMQALNSVFVQGIKNGNLNQEGFGAYNIQDAVYCYMAKMDMDIAAGNATDPFVRSFLQARSASYKKYYERLFQTWQIQDPKGILLNQACSGYINHEHDVAMSYDPVYFVMALIPCAKLWPWLGQQIGVNNASNFGVYTDWAQENFNPDDSGVAKYENLINEADLQGKVDRKKALWVYSGSMKGEADFFNSVKTH